MPKRIQLKRTKGWRKPAGAVVVSRPSRWGNPYSVDEVGREQSIKMFAQYINDKIRIFGPEILTPLRGKDLCCWCKPGEACHADVLLALANAEQPNNQNQAELLQPRLVK